MLKQKQDPSAVYQQDNFFWQTMTELPSKFRPYDVRKLEWRSLTYGEMKRLSAPNLTEWDKIDIAKHAIRGIDVGELSYPDYQYLTLYIGVQTNPSRFWRVVARCPFCGHSEQKEIHPDKFVFEDMKIKQVPVVIRHGDHEIHLDVLRVKDIERLKQIPDNLVYDLALLAIMTRNIEFAEAYKLFYNMDSQAAQLIESLEQEMFHGILPTQVVCGSCARDYGLKVGLEVADFIPFRPVSDLDRNSVLSRV